MEDESPTLQEGGAGQLPGCWPRWGAVVLSWRPHSDRQVAIGVSATLMASRNVRDGSGTEGAETWGQERARSPGPWHGWCPQRGRPQSLGSSHRCTCSLTWPAGVPAELDLPRAMGILVRQCLLPVSRGEHLRAVARGAWGHRGAGAHLPILSNPDHGSPANLQDATGSQVTASNTPPSPTASPQSPPSTGRGQAWGLTPLL